MYLGIMNIWLIGLTALLVCFGVLLFACYFSVIELEHKQHRLTDKISYQNKFINALSSKIAAFELKSKVTKVASGVHKDRSKFNRPPRYNEYNEEDNR